MDIFVEKQTHAAEKDVGALIAVVHKHLNVKAVNHTWYLLFIA